MNLWNDIPIDPEIHAASRRIVRVRIANAIIAMSFGALAFCVAALVGATLLSLLMRTIPHTTGNGIGKLAGFAALATFVGVCRTAAFFFRRARPEDVALLGTDAS